MLVLVEGDKICVRTYRDLTEYKHTSKYLISPTSKTSEGMLGIRILPPFSFSQPVIAEEKIIWGTYLNFLPFFAPHTQHSTAQSTRTSSKAIPRRSDRDNASKQSWLDPACRGVYAAHCSQNVRSNRNLPGLEKYTTIHQASS